MTKKPNKLDALRERYEKQKAKTAGEGDFSEKYLNIKLNETVEFRILPLSDDVADYLVETGKHYVDDDTKVNCPRVDGGKCPICDVYFDVWKSINEIGDERNNESPLTLELLALAKASKMTSRYYYNVLDRRDGKVKILTQGYKVYAKILDGQFNQDWGNGEVSVADPKNGWDFALTLKKVKDYNNYDTSTFRVKSTVLGTDAEIKQYMDERHDLTEFAQLPEYGELKLIAENLSATHKSLLAPSETAGMEPTTGSGIDSEQDFIDSLGN